MRSAEGEEPTVSPPPDRRVAPSGAGSPPQLTFTLPGLSAGGGRVCKFSSLETGPSHSDSVLAGFLNDWMSIAARLPARLAFWYDVSA